MASHIGALLLLAAAAVASGCGCEADFSDCPSSVAANAACEGARYSCPLTADPYETCTCTYPEHRFFCCAPATVLDCYRDGPARQGELCCETDPGSGPRRCESVDGCCECRDNHWACSSGPCPGADLAAPVLYDMSPTDD